MRQIVVSLVALLAATGLLVGFGGALGLEAGATRLLSLVHTWGGVLFVVMFPLYAWDHIRANRHWLTALRLTSVSGALQTLAAAVLLLTGVVLIAYGVQTWYSLRAVHHWLTYPMLALLALHFVSPKRW